MTGTTPPLVPTITFTFDEIDYTAIADHMMIVRYERAADKSFAHILLHLERVRLIGDMPKFSEFAYLLQAMLGEHHPDVGLDLTMQMVSTPEVMEHIVNILTDSMPRGSKDDDRPLAKAAKEPPAKRRALKKSGTGNA